VEGVKGATEGRKAVPTYRGRKNVKGGE